MEVVANKTPKLRFPNFQGDWKNKQLKEVGQIVNGLTYSPENINENGVLVLRSSNIQNGSLAFDDNVYVDVEDFNPVEKNDILICVRNGSRRLIGKNALITEDISGVAFGAFMTVFRSEINEFIFQLFSTSNYYKTIHQNLGATINSINNGDLKKFRFSFPSQNEQQKIATFLSSVDKKLDQLQKKKELLEQYKKGMMQMIFKQEIRFKDEYGKNFPKWEEKKLGKITTLLKDGSHGSHKDDPDGCHYLLSAKNIINGSITIDSNDRRISETEYNSIYKNYKLQKNDLLLSIVGSIGRVAKYKNEENVVFQRSVAFFRFPKYNPDFMLQLMISENFQNELNRRKVVSAQPGIYLGDLAKISMRIPCLKEQTKIADFLSAIDDKIDLVATEIDKASQFKKGLLQQMFI